MANHAYRFEVPVPAGVKLGVRGEFSDVSGGVLWVRSTSAEGSDEAQEQLADFAQAVADAAKEAKQGAD